MTDGNYLGNELSKESDRVLGSAFTRWWVQQNSNVQAGYRCLIGALAFGPLGMGIVSIAQAVDQPTLKGQIIGAWWWLFIITLPVWLIGAAIATMWGKSVSLQFILFYLVVAVAVGFAILGEFNAPQSLSHEFCYASVKSGRLYYVSQCRQLTTAGLIAPADIARLGIGNPTGNASFLAKTIIYFVDLRGTVMTLAGLVAGYCTGYILRFGTF